MACMLCGDKIKPWLKMPLDPKKKSRSQFDSFYFCNQCSFGSMFPLPTIEDISGFYNLSSYYTQNAGHMPHLKKGFFDKLLTKFSYWADHSEGLTPEYFRKSFKKGSKVLDIGSGGGSKLVEYVKFGWETYGLEPDINSASLNQLNSIKVYQGTAESVPPEINKKQFDFISMTHVLEHCLDPVMAIKNVHSLLKKNGTFWVEVPNNACEHFKQFNICSEMFDAPRHIHFFDEKSLKRILENNGFVIEKIYFHGFTRHFDLDWRAWERSICKEVERIAPELNPPDHTFWASVSLLLKSFNTTPEKKYDCVGIIARRL
jgi:SAM-dependent methyltransferase